MQPTTAVIGCKPDRPTRPLLTLARWVLSPPATIHLVSAVRVGTEGDEQQRLDSVRRSLQALADELEAEGFAAPGSRGHGRDVPGQRPHASG